MIIIVISILGWVLLKLFIPYGGMDLSTLVQLVACCLAAASHYLNQCWLIISGVLWHSPESNFTGSAHKHTTIMCSEITLLKFHAHLSMANALNYLKQSSVPFILLPTINISHQYRNHFVYAPSQWETALHCNIASHWMGTYTKWSLQYFVLNQ